MSVNIISLLGRVGKDPEMRTFGENKMASFSLATSETYKDKSGNKKEETQWHNCVAWGSVAGVVEKYVKKGEQLFITGKLVYEQYEKDGVTRTIAKIRVEKLTMIGGGRRDDSSKPAPQSQPDVEPESGDDFPFIITILIAAGGLLPYLF